MKRERKSQRLGQACRQITSKGAKNAIFKAESLAPDGSVLELHTQAEMVAAMGASNLSQQRQCMGTPSMSPPFTTDFGYLADSALLQLMLFLMDPTPSLGT